MGPGRSAATLAGETHPRQALQPGPRGEACSDDAQLPRPATVPRWSSPALLPGGHPGGGRGRGERGAGSRLQTAAQGEDSHSHNPAIQKTTGGQDFQFQQAGEGEERSRNKNNKAINLSLS